MDNPNITLTKICSSCGRKKSLSAFLQLTDQQGASYGNICATCRKTSSKIATSKEQDGGTKRTTGGAKIGVDERIAGEIGKKDHFQHVETDYREEREKDAAIQFEQTEKTQKIAKGEKEHRMRYIEKRSFLESSEKARQTATAPVFGGEQQMAKEREINLSAPVIDTQIAGKIKHQTAQFQQFKTWLGGSAPIVKHAQKAAEQSPEKNNPIDYIKETWGPHSKKKP